MTRSFVDVNGIAGSEALQMVDLHSAAKQDDREAVVRLIKEGTNVNKRDPYGYTPLHWASQKGHTHTVQALLAAGASVHVVSVPLGKIKEKGGRNNRSETTNALNFRTVKI